MAHDEPFVADVLAHRVLDEPALAEAGGGNGLRQAAIRIGGEANVERSHVIVHIARISYDIVTYMNLYEPTWDAEVADRGSVLRAVRLAQHAGARRLAANLYELAPGATVSPLHFHHANEELLLVISGTPTLRLGPDAEQVLAPGDVVAFPVGPDGTHQIVNRSDAAARVLICATNDLPEVAEQVENHTLAIITTAGLRLAPDTPLVVAP